MQNVIRCALHMWTISLIRSIALLAVRRSKFLHVYDYVTVCIKTDVVTYYRDASVKHSRTFAVHCKIAVYTHVQVWCLGRELQIPC